MATTGFSGGADTVQASATDGSYQQVAESFDVTMDISAAELDITTHADTNVQRMAGLKDASVSMTVRYAQGEASQSLFWTQYDAGDNIFIQILPDGTNGYKGEFMINSMSLPVPVDGQVEQSIDLSLANGGLTAVP